VLIPDQHTIVGFSVAAVSTILELALARNQPQVSCGTTIAPPTPDAERENAYATVGEDHAAERGATKNLALPIESIGLCRGWSRFISAQ
jgi:hypothetical protein